VASKTRAYQREGDLSTTWKGMVEGMENFSLDLDFCEHFLYGKQN
jgi:predicted Ser/Thr protein kinase